MDNILEDIQASANAASPPPDTSPDVSADVAADVASAAQEGLSEGSTVEPSSNSDANSTETAAEAAQRARDEAGRFTKAKAAATPKPTAPQKTPPAQPKTGEAAPALEAQPQPATPPAPALKAPQSWRPGVREHWAKLPPEVQQEVDRRERETARALSESAPARQHFEAFQQTLQPYRALLTDEPLKVVGNLLQTAAQLQTAPPAHKAAMVASIIKQYGVPIDALDAALAGEGAPQQPGSPQQAYDQQALIQQAKAEFAREQAAARQQAMVQREAANVEKFAAEHEFFEDVRPVMHALLQSGRAADLKDAYDKACWADPEVRAALLQRQQAQAATSQRASTQAALAASASVRSAPAGVTPPRQSASILDDVQAAAAELSGR